MLRLPPRGDPLRHRSMGTRERTSLMERGTETHMYESESRSLLNSRATSCFKMESDSAISREERGRSSVIGRTLTSLDAPSLLVNQPADSTFRDP